MHLEREKHKKDFFFFLNKITAMKVATLAVVDTFQCR